MIRNFSSLSLMSLMSFSLLGATIAAKEPPKAEAVSTTKGVVVCVSPVAAEVGVQILRDGGNAVDAAIAVGFAQAVTWPEAGNIGGGGFMLIWPGRSDEPIVIDYRETAPASATADLLARDADPLTLRAAGVPGTVRGMALAHQKFGSRSWKDLVMPAVRLAEGGFTVTPALARSLNQVLNSDKTTNQELRRCYGKPGGGLWQAGDTLILPDLGKTLRKIAEDGPDAFYTGTIAELLVAEMKAGNGLITATDLQKYQAKVRKPIHGQYRGYDLITVAPPSGGGIVLVESLNILENFRLAEYPRNDPRTVHRIAESLRRAYADRARYLGDPDFTTIPAKLTEKSYAQELAATIRADRATPSEAVAPDIPLSDSGGETTHYSIVDRHGMAVANTYTLENSWGNRIVVRGAGYVLNNEMTDFNHRPGHTDRSGRIGTLPNQIAPGKRMLSSQCPTILLKNGQPILVTGSPGGRTIPNTVLSIIIHVVDYGMSVPEAISAPRIHHQWFPDEIQHEETEDFPRLKAGLEALGHKVKSSRFQGDAHSVGIDPRTGVHTGVADRRIEGKAVAE